MTTQATRDKISRYDIPRYNYSKNFLVIRCEDHTRYRQLPVRLGEFTDAVRDAADERSDLRLSFENIPNWFERDIEV